MRNVFTIACLALSILPSFGAAFPYITLNTHTNRLSDNGTNLTYNGTAIGGSSLTITTQSQSGTNVVVDFSIQGIRVLTATNDLYFSATNIASTPTWPISLKVYAGAVNRLLSWDTNWVPIGLSLPLTLSSNKVLRITMDSDGTSATNINVSTAAQP